MMHSKFLGLLRGIGSRPDREPHYKFKVEGIKVWWEQCFADGLISSSIFVLVISKVPLAPCALLTCVRACDNVVLGHQLALELKHRGDMRAMFSVLVGELRHDCELSDFVKGGGMPMCNGHGGGSGRQAGTASGADGQWRPMGHN